MINTKNFKSGNIAATKSFADAYKLHQLLFGYIYPYPLAITIKSQNISVKVDKLLRFKYIPFYIALILITTIIGFGTCVFLPIFKLFNSSSSIGVIGIVICLFLGSCSFLEWATYLVYLKSSEVVPLVNQVFEIERRYYKLGRKKRVDYIGLFLIFVHLSIYCIAPFLPIVGILWDLDPFYHAFELVLPSKYDRSLILILTVPLIRLFLGLVCVYEFSRFVCILFIVLTAVALTMVTCLRQLVNQSSRSEWRTLKLYTQLRIVLKIGDYFLHFVLLFLLTCEQFILTALWWLVLKCWDVLPIFITIMVFLIAVIGTVAVSIILPSGAEICSTSQKFILHKKAINHTFNKHSNKKYFFLKWESQRMLPIRFGSQFTLSKSTPIGYLNIFITNLTNAVLLVNP